MRIFLTGDKHGDFEGLKYFCRINEMTKEDIIIVLGDSGINYSDKLAPSIKKFISSLPATFVCIHGNHEARPSSLESYTVTYNEVLNCNCWVEPEYPSILFPFDGIMTINGLKFLVMGGAYSIDKDFRLLNNFNWFEDEQMSEADKNYIYNLISFNNEYDYVLTHTAPISMEPKFLFAPYVDQSRVDKTMENFLERVKNQIKFKHWYFGHYHANARLTDNFTILYTAVEEITIPKPLSELNK